MENPTLEWDRINRENVYLGGPLSKRRHRHTRASIYRPCSRNMNRHKLLAELFSSLTKLDHF